MKRGIGGQATCHRPPEPNGQQFSERSRMHEEAMQLRATSRAAVFSLTPFLMILALLLFLLSCSQPPDPNTLVMIIESSPVNLDPRVGIDAQSERIDALIFDDLLDRDD